MIKSMESKINILNEDFENICKQDISLEKFRNKSFLITGATGLIGSLIARYLLYCNNAKGLNTTVFALVRSEKKARNLYEVDGQLPRGLKLYIHELGGTDGIELPHVDYIIHAAAITKSKVMVTNPVETIITSINGTEEVLKFANNTGADGVVYISSMEAYGTVDKNGMTSEDELGQIALENVRSCYPESKRMCEMLCNAYASEYGMNIKSARLAQTFGAGILKGENRVFAQFARSAITGNNIVLHTEGKSEGNYVYSADAVAAVLMLLAKGKTGEAYNIANEDSHTTVREMAELVANEVTGGKIKVRIDIPKDGSSLGYAPDTKLYLSSEKMRALGWKPEVGLLEAYQRMIAWMMQT